MEFVCRAKALNLYIPGNSYFIFGANDVISKNGYYFSNPDRFYL